MHYARREMNNKILKKKTIIRSWESTLINVSRIPLSVSYSVFKASKSKSQLLSYNKGPRLLYSL